MENNLPILLVEDDEVDAMTVERALKDINILNHLEIVKNGVEALNYLKDLNNVRPGIILLDLNLPKMNGIEFLEIAKKDNSIKRIPVIVLTTSQEDEDKVESFNLGVAGYMIKPVDYIKFVEVVRAISMYWTLSEIS